MKMQFKQFLLHHRLSPKVLLSLIYCQVGRTTTGLQTGRAIVFISPSLITALGENKEKTGQES